MSTVCAQTRTTCVAVASFRPAIKTVKGPNLTAPAKSARVNSIQLGRSSSSRFMRRSTREEELRSVRPDTELQTEEKPGGCPVYDENGFTVGWQDASVAEECEVPEIVEEERASEPASVVEAKVAGCDISNAGCMDPVASNYDPMAECDDGSCTYPTEDCENGECEANWD